MEFPFEVQLLSSDLNFGIHEDHRVQAFNVLMSSQFALKHQCVYMNKAIGSKSPIFYHSSTTFCSLDFCVKSTENCILHFSHYSLQCCNTIWISKIRNNHKVHPCGSVYMSSTGDRMWEKDETPPLRKTNSQEIYIFDKGAQFKTDPR